MAGITSTELKLPRFRKRVGIGMTIAFLLICGLVLLPGIIHFNFQVDWRVNSALHMIPEAELRYSDTADQNGFMKVRKFIYWISSPYEQVKDYPFVTNYRESSDPQKASGFIDNGSNYSYRAYFLSDLSQKELDKILYFESDLCCYGKVPYEVTVINFYVISANGVHDEDYNISQLDYQRLAGNETTGTYIVYTYRIQ